MSILMVELQSGALACAGFGLGTGGSVPAASLV